MPLPRKPREPKILTEEEQLNKLYVNLHKQIESGSLSKSLITVNKILRISPEDVLALNTKCQILISLDNYSEVLNLLSNASLSNKLENSTSLKLYCQYKNGRENEVRESLVNWEEHEDLGDEERERTGKVLEAQVLYRLEDYETSRNVFEDLIATVDVDSPELADLQTNLEACNSHLDFLSSVPSLLESSSISIPSIEILESTPIAHLISTHPLYRIKPFASTSKPLASTSIKPSKKSKSTTVPKKLPKYYKPDVVPDPDRWLPKRERPQFADQLAMKRENARGKRKGKEREKLLVQGGIESVTPVKAGGGGGGGGGGKKKKGKK